VVPNQGAAASVGVIYNTQGYRDLRYFSIYH